MVSLFRIYSAVYGPTDPILGREVFNKSERGLIFEGKNPA